MTEHPWVRLCELASCSPDFDVIYRFDKRQACDWLAQRLEDHHLTVHRPNIEAAYDSWCDYLAKATGIEVGRMKL